MVIGVQKLVQRGFPIPASNTERKMGCAQFERSKGDESPIEQDWTTSDEGDGENPQIQSRTSALNN